MKLRKNLEFRNVESPVRVEFRIKSRDISKDGANVHVLKSNWSR